MMELTRSQKAVLEYLKYDGVKIETKDNNHFVTKFGLKFKAISQNTFSVLRPYLQHHNINGSVFYTPKP